MKTVAAVVLSQHTLHPAGDGLPRLKLKLDVVQTPSDIATGMKGRVWMPENGGMLFAFPSDTRGSFHNEGTLLPLDLSFLDASGRFLQTLPMASILESREPRIYSPSQPYRYALETSRGALQRAGVEPGDFLVYAGA